MKNKIINGALILSLAATFSACCARQQSNLVKETFIHKYGVPVAKADWDAQGQDGKVVQLRTDGVTVTRNYVNGVLEGETTYSFPNSSTTQAIELYASGILKWKKECYFSGVPRKEEIFEQGELMQLTRWYEDGTPAAVEIFQQGRIVTGEYRTPLNIIESRVVQGEGIRLCRSNEGELLFKDTLINGSLSQRISYFPNGDPESITPYVGGMIHGTRYTYFPGGLPNTVEEWLDGDQEGITTFFQNGEKMADALYVQNQKNGIEYRYRDGKILVEEVTWQSGEQHGPRKLYVDGDIKTEWYHHGELVSRTTFERLNPAYTR